MWKMVIADDEQVILNGLKRLLDWEKLGIEIVGEAADGEMLLTEIYEKEPDLVITDIKMPKKTGLDVIKEVQEKEIKTRFIFISGYEEFAYAKDAVRYGAVDYLLKPVGVEDFASAVKKALSQLQDTRTIRMFREEKNELQQIFQNINEGCEYAKEELYRRFGQEQIRVEDCYFAGVCFGMIVDSTLEAQMSYEQMGLLRFGIYNKLVEEFRKRRMGFLIKKEEEFCDLMAVIPREHREDFIPILLLPLKEQVEREMHVKLCMGIGQLVDTARQWKLSYKTAKFACELYYFEEQPVIDSAEISREYTVSFDDFNRILEEVFQKIAARDETAMESIGQALSAIRDIHYGNRYAAVNRVLLFTGALLEKLFAVELAEGDFTQRQNEVQEAIRYQNTYRQLCRWLTEYYREFLRQIYRSAKNKTSGEIMRVKNYIREHYMEDLSLKELAEAACVSQNYFSSLFKKETGENYKSYVTRIRMEEAIKLVLKTDLKTYEISEQVGYNNVRRFVDAFKQTYKMSPMDYRRIYRKK